MSPLCRRYNGRSTRRIRCKDKSHSLDIAPPGEAISLQKRSGMARVVEGLHSFTHTPTRLSANGINHTCVSLPSRSWSSFTDTGGSEG